MRYLILLLLSVNLSAQVINTRDVIITQNDSLYFYTASDSILCDVYTTVFVAPVISYYPFEVEFRMIHSQCPTWGGCRFFYYNDYYEQVVLREEDIIFAARKDVWEYSLLDDLKAQGKSSQEIGEIMMNLKNNW